MAGQKNGDEPTEAGRPQPSPETGDGPSAIAARSGEMSCELCGAGFTCEQRDGCWCSRIRVSAGMLTHLKTRADGCVCPACLEAVPQ